MLIEKINRFDILKRELYDNMGRHTYTYNGLKLNANKQYDLLYNIHKSINNILMNFIKN